MRLALHRKNSLHVALKTLVPSAFSLLLHIFLTLQYLLYVYVLSVHHVQFCLLLVLTR